MNVFPRLLLLFVICLFVLLPSSCLMHSNSGSELGTWNFSGVVVDGSTEKSLRGVEISYVDNDGEVKSTQCEADGKFFIDNLPYGERTFVFNYAGSDSNYTSRNIVVASYAEASSLGGVIGDVAKIVTLYPLTGRVSGTLVYQPHGTDYQLPAASASLHLAYEDSSMVNAEPTLFTTETDSSGKFIISGLPLAPGGIIGFDNFEKKDVLFTLGSIKIGSLINGKSIDIGKLIYTTIDTIGWKATMLTSNVLSADGFGRKDVSVDDTIWYKLPVMLQPGSVVATLNAGGAPNVNAIVKKDTLFLVLANQLAYDTLVEVKIEGNTTDGEKFDITLGGAARFRTEKSPYPVETNFWSQPWLSTGRFDIGQTLWVRFSEKLNTTLSNYTWVSSSAASTIYGTGVSTNAKITISGDTLFITPDQRLQFTYNSTIGFNVQARTLKGKYLQYYDFAIQTIEDPLYTVWTNTRDGMGNDRVDIGLRDTLKVVSSLSKFSVVGVSAGATGIAPPGLLLSDVKVAGDTIIYLPSLSMKSDTVYSVDFDIKLSDGTIRRDVLEMTWTTKNKVAIVGTDIRINGMYRPLAAIGDSFKVTFNEPIDTSAKAAVVFRVNIKDVNDVKMRSNVRWDKPCQTATVFVLDTLPTADFDAPAAYTATATGTRAVVSVTFDLVTKSGEQVLGCKPEGDPISLHSEKGLCIINTTIVPNLDGRTSVENDFTPATEFSLDGVIKVQFSRPVDTATMRMDSLGLYAGIHKAGAVIVPSKVTLQSDLMTVLIDPSESLEMKTNYYLWIKGVPARGIAGAAPINKHGGTFTGTSGASYLLDRPFRTE